MANNDVELRIRADTKDAEAALSRLERRAQSLEVSSGGSIRASAQEDASSVVVASAAVASSIAPSLIHSARATHARQVNVFEKGQKHRLFGYSEKWKNATPRQRLAAEHALFSQAIGGPRNLTSKAFSDKNRLQRDVLRKLHPQLLAMGFSSDEAVKMQKRWLGSRFSRSVLNRSLLADAGIVPGRGSAAMVSSVVHAGLQAGTATLARREAMAAVTAGIKSLPARVAKLWKGRAGYYAAARANTLGTVGKFILPTLLIKGLADTSDARMDAFREGGYYGIVDSALDKTRSGLVSFSRGTYYAFRTIGNELAALVGAVNPGFATHLEDKLALERTEAARAELKSQKEPEIEARAIRISKVLSDAGRWETPSETRGEAYTAVEEAVFRKIDENVLGAGRYARLHGIGKQKR